MNASSINQLIDELQDSASALTSLPISNGDTKRLNCVFKKMQSPHFRLIFPPNSLPTGNIEPDSQFSLSIKQDTSSVTLNARIEDIEDDRTLRVVATETIRPELLREYFRVAFRTPIRASFNPDPGESDLQPWSLEGETIDISGGGILAILSGEPENPTDIQLELTLPNHPDTLTCFSRLIRCRKLGKNKCRVAFHFEKISNKTRDTIISFCLQEQRRQLRNRVRIE